MRGGLILLRGWPALNVCFCWDFIEGIGAEFLGLMCVSVEIMLINYVLKFRA